MRLRSDHLGLVGALVLLAAADLLILQQLPLSVFWSPDGGGKYLQMSGYQVGLPLKYKLIYPGIVRDPEFEFYSSNHVYPQPQSDHRVEFGDAPAFPFLSILPYRLLGLPGLYGVPLVCGLLTAFFSGLLASRLWPGTGPFVILCVGFASPILFYSLLFWEHTVATALCMGSLWLTVRMAEDTSSRNIRRSFGLVLLLLLAVALRFEMLVFVVSLPLALFATFRRQREAWPAPNALFHKHKLLWWATGATVILLAGFAGILPRILGERFMFPSLEFLLPLACKRIADPQVWRQIPSCFSRWLVNDGRAWGPLLHPGWTCAGNAGLVFCLSSLALPKRVRMTVFIAGTILVALMSLHGLTLCQRYRAIHSILLPAPYLVLAVLCLPDLRQRRSFAAMWLIAVPFVYLMIYMMICLATDVDADIAQLEWGPRYVLLIFPLMAILAVFGFRKLWIGSRTPLARAGFAAGGAALLCLGMAYQARGIRELQITKQDLNCVQREIERDGVPVVTDLWFLMGSLGPCFAQIEFYTLESNADFKRWMDRIGCNLDRFSHIGFGRFEPEQTHLGTGRITLLDRKIVGGMTFSKFEAAGDRMHPKSGP